MTQPVRKYKDLNLNLLVHPNTQDLVYLKDEEAVKKAVKNMILTSFYERHFDDAFGCHIKELLFEPVSYFTAVSIQSSVENILSMYEPRVLVLDIAVIPEPDENRYEVSITFQVQNILVPIKIQMFLERVR